nr:disease resistance protein (TIR-NBS-LRR class) family [Tanacetum cinerariifolium]
MLKNSLQYVQGCPLQAHPTRLRLSDDSDPSSITPGPSTSSSSYQKSFTYDVFLSFRGEDTRKTFVDHLFHALKDKGIYTYKDDETIHKGEQISDEFIKAIEDSKFYIIVFSKNYTSSSWCFNELVKIMESHKMSEHTAYPVFYDVEPTEVRKQSGVVGEAFAKHENEEAAEKWKSFDEKLVGMETRVKDVVSSLEVGTDEVRMIGIKGMGGAGKTTTARAVFDHLSADLEAKSFVENVREVSKASMFGLKNLQEQVLSKVLNERVTLDSVNDGKNMMKRRMCGKKVLLVLDDVDHIEQLEALASAPNWFKPGSRIIVTTRDEQVLAAHRMNLIRDIDLFSDKEAICLFNAIERLEKIPLKETMEKLELSYTSLEDEYKKIFLDIACILKGNYKEDAIRILESFGFHARIGLKVLEERSLITISSKYGEPVLGMHDHIEEMGKNIVRREHPDEPNKHSRLWIKEEIEDILENDMGTEATRCLKLTTSIGNSRIGMKRLGKMKKLQYLEVDLAYKNEIQKLQFLEVNFSYYKSNLPNSLKYLKCTNYPFLYLPKTFQANYLVGLDMKYSKMVQLRKKGEKKVFEKLKFVSLDWSDLTTFDFRITPNLETLSLDYSYHLGKLCMPVTCKKLKHLSISVSKLRNFDLGLTPNLEKLSLENPFKLVKLSMPASCQKLTYLSISGSELRTFDLGLTQNLETLSLFMCTHFVKLQVSAPCPNLRSLDLYKSRLRSLDRELIPNLERMEKSRWGHYKPHGRPNEIIYVRLTLPPGVLPMLMEFYETHTYAEVVARIQGLVGHPQNNFTKDTDILVFINEFDLEESDAEENAEFAKFQTGVGEPHDGVGQGGGRRGRGLGGAALAGRGDVVGGVVREGKAGRGGKAEAFDEVFAETSKGRGGRRATRGPNVGKGIGTEEDLVVVEDAGGKCVHTHRGGQISSLVEAADRVVESASGRRVRSRRE